MNYRNLTPPKNAEVQKEWYKSHDPSEYIENELR